MLNINSMCTSVSGSLIKSPRSPRIYMIIQGYFAGCADWIYDQITQWTPPLSDIQNKTQIDDWRPKLCKPLDEGIDGTKSPWVYHHQVRPWVPYQMWGLDLQAVAHLGPMVKITKQTQTICILIRFQVKFAQVLEKLRCIQLPYFLVYSNYYATVTHN